MLSSLRKWIVSNKSFLATLVLYTTVVLIVLGIIYYITRSSPKGKSDISIIPEVEQIKDINGKTAALIQQYNAERASNKVLIDSLAHALSIKAKEVTSIDRYITKVDTLWRDSITYIPATADIDSTIIRRRDDYVDILAVGKSVGSYIKFRFIDDTLTRIVTEHNPLFGRATTNVYLRHSNPYYYTPQGSSFTIDQKKPIFSIGVSLGYDVINNRVSFGPTITKPIKTFYRR